MQARQLPVRGAAPEPVHMPLLMLVPSDPRTGARVRLLQDFGTSQDPAGLGEEPPLQLPLCTASPEPTRRKHGRPPGSRTRMPRATGHDPGPTTF
jgi:hypothetical protein